MKPNNGTTNIIYIYTHIFDRLLLPSARRPRQAAKRVSGMASYAPQVNFSWDAMKLVEAELELLKMENKGPMMARSYHLRLRYS